MDYRKLETRRTNLYNARYITYNHGHYGSHNQFYSAYFRVDNSLNQKFFMFMDTTTTFYDDFYDFKASKKHEYGHPIRMKVYYYNKQIRSTMYLRDAYHYCWSRRISWKWWRYWPRRHFGCRFWWMQHRPAHTRVLARNVDFTNSMWKGKWFKLEVFANAYFVVRFGNSWYGPTAWYHYMRHPRYGWWLPWYYYMGYRSALQRGFALFGSSHTWNLDHYRLYRSRKAYTPQMSRKYKGSFEGYIFGSFNGWYDAGRWFVQSKLLYFIPGVNKTAKANNYYRNLFPDGNYNIYYMNQNKWFDNDQPLHENFSLTQRFPGYVFRPLANNPHINATPVGVNATFMVKKSNLFKDKKTMSNPQFYKSTLKYNNGVHWWFNEPFYRMLDAKGEKQLFTASLQYLVWRHRSRNGWGWYPWWWMRTFCAMHKDSNAKQVWSPRNYYSHTPMWDNGYNGWNSDGEKLLTFLVWTQPYYWYPGRTHLYWKSRRYGYHIANTWYWDNFGGHAWIGHFLTEGMNAPNVSHHLVTDTPEYGSQNFRLFHFSPMSLLSTSANQFAHRNTCDNYAGSSGNEYFQSSNFCNPWKNHHYKPMYMRRHGCNWVTGCGRRDVSYCGKVDTRKMVNRSNWRTECVHPGKVLKKQKKSGRIICGFKIKNCEVLNYSKNDCVKCRPGYEKVIKVGRKWIRRQYAEKKRVNHKFDNFLKNSHARCRPCSNSQIYHMKTQECLSARRDSTREYTVNGGNHKFGPLSVPNYKKSPWVIVNFDIAVYHRNVKRHEPKIFLESILKYRTAGMFKQKLRKIEDYHDARFKRTTLDARRIWSDVTKGHYDKKTKEHYYRIFFQHRVKRNSEIWLDLKVNVANDPKEEVKNADFYVKRFRYRIDPFSERKNKASLYEKQYASKISNIARDRVVKTKKPRKVDRDYPFKMERVKKGVRLPYSIRDMYMGFSGGFTGAQGWVKFTKDILETYDSHTPILVMQSKNFDASQTITYGLYADLGENKLYIKKNFKIIEEYGAEEVEFEKWQFVGLAWKKSVTLLNDQICLYIISTTENSTVYSPDKGIECKSYPSTGEKESVRARFGTDTFDDDKAKINGFFYGATISTEPLHLNYYAERNIHLNFLSNPRENELKVKNYARSDNKNDADVLYEVSQDFYKPFYSNSDIEGAVYVVARNMPRNAFNDIGPIKESFYISGYVEFTDNSEVYNVLNPYKWETEIPFYMMRSPDGRDIMKFSHHAKHDSSKIFKEIKGDKAVGSRMQSKINIDYLLYDPETGAALKNFDRTPYEGWQINLGDFKSKSTRFMFNIFFRPTYKWYRLDNKKSFNHILTVRHSWGVFEQMALFNTADFTNEKNLHLLGHKFNGFNKYIMPVITKYITFTHTYGPLKYAELKYHAQVLKPAKEKVKGWETMDSAALEEKRESLASTKIRVGVQSITYSALDNYNDIYSTFGKVSRYDKKTKEYDNYASGFTTGPSLGCEHGTFLVTFDRTPVCAAPPKPNTSVKFKQTYSGVRSHIPKWQLVKKKGSWNPFDRSWKKKKGSGKSVKRYAVAGSVQDDNSCFRDQLNQCVACKEGYYFSKGGSTFKYSATPPYTFMQSHANSGCHQCQPDCKVCDKRGCLECSNMFEYDLALKKCLPCASNKVYDPFTKRCFTEKQNNFLDIFYNKGSSKVIIQDIFGWKENRTAIFNLRFRLAAKDKAGKTINTEPLFIEVRTEAGKLKNSYVFDEIDVNVDRLVMFRSLIPAAQDMKMEVFINGKTEANFEYYKLVSFKYSLVMEQKGGILDKQVMDDLEANRKVTVDDLGHRKGFKYRDNFDIGFALKLDQFVPPDVAKIKGINERDDVNGNWIQTWYKVDEWPRDPTDPKKWKPDVTIISFRGRLESPVNGEKWRNYRVYFDYLLKKLMFDNGEGGVVMIKEFGDNADKGKWNYVGILIRKIYSNGTMKFQIIGTSTHDDIDKFVIDHKFDSKFRRLERQNRSQLHSRIQRLPEENLHHYKARKMQKTNKLHKKHKVFHKKLKYRKLKHSKINKKKFKKLRKSEKKRYLQEDEEEEEEEGEDEEGEGDEEEGEDEEEEEEDEDDEDGDDEDKEDKSPANQKPLGERGGSGVVLLEKENTSWFLPGHDIIAGFAVKKPGQKWSDLSGSIYGSNMYSKYISPYEQLRTFFYLNRNDLGGKGLVRNIANTDVKSRGQFVYMNTEEDAMTPFYDDVSIGKGGNTYIKAVHARFRDSPNEMNVIISGDVELRSNLETWKIKGKGPLTEKIDLINVKNSEDRSILKITHEMDIPGDKSKTTSKLIIQLTQSHDGDFTHITKSFCLEDQKYGIMRYQFRFNTSLKLIYFLPRDTESNNNIYFRDSLGSMVEMVGTAEAFMDDEHYTSYLSQTFEKINPVLTVSNHKWHSFGLAFASPFYDWDKSKDPKELYGSRLYKYPLSCKFGYTLGYTEYEKIAC